MTRQAKKSRKVLHPELQTKIRRILTKGVSEGPGFKSGLKEIKGPEFETFLRVR